MKYFVIYKGVEKMGKFVGQVCPVCQQKFKDQDDIVVCPECGTPHHRSCYQEIGHCANQSKHGTEWEYETKPVTPNRESQQDQPQQSGQKHNIVCSQCGANNPPNGLFCLFCGAPLQQKDGVQTPQNTVPQQLLMEMSLGGLHPEDSIDGISVKDFAAFIGSNTAYYLPKFKRFSEKKFLSFNFSAAIISPVYYLFRKMIPLGILFLIINLLATFCYTIVQVNTIVPIQNSLLLNIAYYGMQAIGIFSTIFGLLSGLFANWIYYKWSVRTIKKCKAKAREDLAKYQELLVKKGSVSPLFVGIGLIFIFLFSIIFSLVLSI